MNELEWLLYKCIDCFRKWKTSVELPKRAHRITKERANTCQRAREREKKRSICDGSSCKNGRISTKLQFFFSLVYPAVVSLWLKFIGNFHAFHAPFRNASLGLILLHSNLLEWTAEKKLKTHKTFFFVAQVKSVFLKIARCDRVHAIQQPLKSVCQDNMNVNV